MRKDEIDIGTMALQNCMGLERAVPSSCSETCPTSSHDANQVMNIKVEQISDVEEEEDPLTFPRIKTEHEVSCTYAYVSTVMHIPQISGIACCISHFHLSIYLSK
jgi:hypothetical protein